MGPSTHWKSSTDPARGDFDLDHLVPRLADDVRKRPVPAEGHMMRVRAHGDSPEKLPPARVKDRHVTGPVVSHPQLGAIRGHGDVVGEGAGIHLTTDLLPPNINDKDLARPPEGNPELMPAGGERKVMGGAPELNLPDKRGRREIHDQETARRLRGDPGRTPVG